VGSITLLGMERLDIDSLIRLVIVLVLSVAVLVLES
jgi:hypothetical protein